MILFVSNYFHLEVLSHGILGLETFFRFSFLMRFIQYQMIGFYIFFSFFSDRLVLWFFIHFEELLSVLLSRVIESLILRMLFSREWNLFRLGLGYLVVVVELVEGFLFILRFNLWRFYTLVECFLKANHYILFLKISFIVIL
jgi:hypothetical protein